MTQVFEDLELNNFTWWIKSVTYDWIELKASIEVYMQENGSSLIHSRSYVFDCLTTWTEEDVTTAITTLPCFA